MLLLLSDDHKKDLAFLPDAGAAAWAALIAVALDGIRNGLNVKQIGSTAQQLGVAGETVKRGVDGLTYLLTESAKKVLSQLDFMDSVLLLGFPDELNQLLLKTYQDNLKEIRSILSKLSVGPPSYHDLQWRLDVQLASRTLRRQTNPLFMIQLDVKDETGVKSHMLQTDPANLLHMTEVLEAALSEMKTAYARRIVRNIK